MTDSDIKQPSSNQSVRKPRAAFKGRAMTETAGDHLDDLRAGLTGGWRWPSLNPCLAIEDGLICYYASGAEHPQRYADEEMAALAIARDLAALPDEPAWGMYWSSSRDFPGEYGRPDFCLGSFLDCVGQHLRRNCR